jgi:tetratricopeptide (TPR) repeat protein
VDEAAQRAEVQGSYNTVVQIVGNGNAVVVGNAHLHLTRYANRRSVKPAAPDAGGTPAGERASDLLSAYSRSLPLLGRERDLVKLDAWLDSGRSVSVRVLTSEQRGGRGKTRLALEFAEARAAAGWRAGFVRAQELRRFRDQQNLSSWGWNAHALIVVDYAADHVGLLRDWLAELAEHAPTDKRLRLLLLERDADPSVGWFASLFGRADGEGRAIADLLDPPGAAVTLGLIEDMAERRAVFEAAFRRAAGPGATPPAIAAQVAAETWGGEPLFLAMAGLYAAQAGDGSVIGVSAAQLALDLARRELDQVASAWVAAGRPEAGRDFARHMAAVATVSGGLSAAGAEAAIEREKAALNRPSIGDAPELRMALFDALPGRDGGLAPILPDLLGEAALIVAWGDGVAGVQAVARAAAVKRDEVVRVVIRACQDFLIRGQRAPLAWLDGVRAKISDLGGLMALAKAMPTATVELREAALSVAEAIVVQLRRHDPSSEPVASALAGGLNNLSGRLMALGRREAALAAIEEAVARYRTLVHARPEVFLPNLATSLSNLSNTLSDLGRREAALAAIEEAVVIRRTLAKAEADAFLPDFAASLNNLSGRFAVLGRREAALAAIEEAVAQYRKLAQGRPDAFLPNLATSLNNLSNSLSNLGRREAALAAIEEAVVHHRTLAQARPDAFLPDLAESLNTLSVQLSALGRREAVLAASEEAVVIRRTLAQARPDAFLPKLATSLNNLSVQLSALGRREAALAAIDEAVAIRRNLVQARPDAVLPDLAQSLGARGSILRETDPAGAACSFREGIETLIGPFLALPQVFVNLMAALARGYIDTCQAAGIAFDNDLLAPIVAALQRLQNDQPPETPP